MLDERTDASVWGRMFSRRARQVREIPAYCSMVTVWGSRTRCGGTGLDEIPAVTFIYFSSLSDPYSICRSCSPSKEPGGLKPRVPAQEICSAA